MRFKEFKERNRIIQRPKHFQPGSKKGRKEMVDMEAKDGGYHEWRVQHWSRRISEKRQELEDAGKAVVKTGANNSGKRRQIYMRGGVAMFTPLVGGGAAVAGTSLMAA